MTVRLPAILAITLVLAGCGSGKPAEPPVANQETPSTPDPTAFQPLQSDAVKDAMHRALTTGETQRWEDAGLSGYAVPGPAGKNGCRAIRYTVDQRPAGNFESITACEAGAAGGR